MTLVQRSCNDRHSLCWPVTSVHCYPSDTGRHFDRLLTACQVCIEVVYDKREVTIQTSVSILRQYVNTFQAQCSSDERMMLERLLCEFGCHVRVSHLTHFFRVFQNASIRHVWCNNNVSYLSCFLLKTLTERYDTTDTITLFHCCGCYFTSPDSMLSELLKFSVACYSSRGTNFGC